MDEVILSSTKPCSNKEKVSHTLTLPSQSVLQNSEDDDFEATSNIPPVITTYPQRFWVLGVFSFLSWFQMCQFNTWGPINQSVMEGFGWSSGTVGMMSNWGVITFILFVTPMCWLTTHHGLRTGVLTSAGLLALGTVIRCVTFEPTAFTVLCHISAICGGIAGTVILTAPPMLAAHWFPTKERITATAVGMASNTFGGLGSYMEPLIVRAPGDDVTQDQIQEDIRILMYIHAGFGTLCFILTLIYFPSHPPMPASISSSTEKLEFKETLKKIFRNKSMIFIILPYSIGIGIPLIWVSIMNFSFNSLGINQDETMWIGIFQSILCPIIGILVGRVTDLVYGYIRGTLISFFLTASVFFYWFSLLTSGTIPVTLWQVYIIVGVAMGLVVSAGVLLFELAVERAYPCSEVIVASVLFVGNTFCGSLFLVCFMIFSTDYGWMSYVLLGSTALAAIPLLFLSDGYNRSKIDRSDML